MWASDQSVADFLTNFPAAVNYIFVSPSAFAADEVRGLHHRLEQGLTDTLLSQPGAVEAVESLGDATADVEEKLRRVAAEAEEKLKHMHFVTQPLPHMQNWIPGLLQKWRSPRKMLIARSGTSTLYELSSRKENKYPFHESMLGWSIIPV